MAPVYSHEAAVERGADYTHAFSTAFLSQAPYVATRRQVLPPGASGYPSRREVGAKSQRAQRRTTTCAPGRVVRVPAGRLWRARDEQTTGRRKPRTAQ